MNTYKKYCPNVFVAQCEQEYKKGDLITITTKYGKEIENEVFNFLGKAKDGLFLYSVIRTDGINAQERAERKAERLAGCAINAGNRSFAYYEASQEGKDFLSLGEPIKIGHHSERRHRRLIERNGERLGKSIAEDEKAKDYQRRAEYWRNKANKIDLSMPESLSFFEFELEKAKKYHQELKNDPNKRAHSMSLQYANKAVKDIEEKLCCALKLWGDEEDIRIMEEEKKQKAETKADKSKAKSDIIKMNNGFFAFNNDQFRQEYDRLKNCGFIAEGEKVVHVGHGLYIPKSRIDIFMNQYK